ncbi:MAG: STAS domain-containing protein [SAR324 cluster bacterium]|nr:STAS domain-containing protein [SAR324 cluster bacterium]
MPNKNKTWDIQEYQVIKMDCSRFDVNSIMDGELSDGIGSLLEAGKKNIILDFSTVTQISSVGIGAIVSAYREVHDQGGTMKIIGTRKSVGEAIKSTRIDQFIELHAFVEG